MTLLFCEGFEGIDRNSVKKIFNDNSFGDTNCSIFSGRFGGSSIGRSTGNTDHDYYWLDSGRYGIVDDTELIIGFAFKLSDGDIYVSPYDFDIINIYTKVSVSTNAFNAWLNDSNYSKYRYPLISDTWYYLEWKFKNANSGGYYEARIDGKVIWTFTGDTLYGTKDKVRGLLIEVGTFTSYQIDDLYFIANDGSGLCDFLGDIRVDTIRPNGAGTYSQMTPSTGSNYQCVDETPWDDTDYVEADTDGEIDTYSFDDVPTDLDDSNIHGVTVDHVAKRMEPYGNMALRNVVRSNGTEYYGSQDWKLNDDGNNVKKSTWESDPDDSNAWTRSKINACEFGVELAKS